MPLLSVLVSHAMLDAVKLHARIQTQIRGHRVTMTDVVLASLRLSGFERDDVLEALQRGEAVAIDVRVRTPSANVLSPTQRLFVYMAEHGCARPAFLRRTLHVSMHDTRRAINAALDAKLAHEKPFDRPRIIHWNAKCQCRVLLAPNDKPEQGAGRPGGDGNALRRWREQRAREQRASQLEDTTELSPTQDMETPDANTIL